MSGEATEDWPNTLPFKLFLSKLWIKDGGGLHGTKARNTNTGLSEISSYYPEGQRRSRPPSRIWIMTTVKPRNATGKMSKHPD